MESKFAIIRCVEIIAHLKCSFKCFGIFHVLIKENVFIYYSYRYPQINLVVVVSTHLMMATKFALSPFQFHSCSILGLYLLPKVVKI